MVSRRGLLGVGLSDHDLLSEGSLVQGFANPWFRDLLVRDSLVRGLVCPGFTCPEVHLFGVSLVRTLVYYDVPSWYRSWINKNNHELWELQ